MTAISQEQANEIFRRIQETLKLHRDACGTMIAKANSVFDLDNPFRRGYTQALAEEIDRLNQSIDQLETAKRPTK